MKNWVIAVVLVLFIGVVAFLSFLLMGAKSELSAAVNTISDKSNQISTLQEDLQNNQGELTLKTDKLVKTTADLNNVTDNLDSVNNELSEKITELSKITSERLNLKASLYSLNSTLTKANDQVDTLNKNLDLYKETFGKVYENLPPLSRVYDTEPPSWSFRLPAAATPLRLMNLIENPDAVNPTYAKLLDFIRADSTDMNRYLLEYYVCGNFAETLHNNAEAGGIRTAMVLIDFKEGPGHAINAFLTTDRGLVYIDSTGSSYQGPNNMDALVTGLKINSTYNDSFLFPSGYYFILDDNRVTDIEIYW